MNSLIENLKNLLQKLEVSRAVGVSMLSNVWKAILIPITIYLIGTRFTLEIQGYHYTFVALLTLSAFSEMGFGTVLIQFSSHEWTNLSLAADGRAQGDPDSLSRLAGIARFCLKWSAGAALFLVLLVGGGGYLFFSLRPALGVAWASPWICLSLLTAVNLVLINILALLEGCNQVSRVYLFRFLIEIAMRLTMCLSILWGFGLWATVHSLLAAVIATALLVLFFYGRFLADLLFKTTPGPTISWREDILPLQMRIGGSWIATFLCFSFFTPVLFYYHGPELAGRMGMTWSIVNGLAATAGAWIFPRFAFFGMLAARKAYDELDALFWKITTISTSFLAISSLVVFGVIWHLHAIDYWLSHRLVSPMALGFLLLGSLIQVSSIPMALYLRAHKQEPIMHLCILAAVLVAVGNLTLGWTFKAEGMAFGFLGAHVLVVPLIARTWNRLRLEWRAAAVASSPPVPLPQSS